ncbi:MAG: hypothetical protein AMJ53_05340 [Gammaproteobacteria bacterium SG8_11]|nr:MAG: hypothetical protein AMJ53_05340 [Gammaproteobacteria bacterium SG8_11]
MDKSAMKRAYKEAKRPMGVYRITSTRDDKVYIGFGTDLAAKINRHKFELRFGSHRNRELQEAWSLFGESAFDFEVLDVLDHKENPQTNPAEELHVLLEMWIGKLEKEGYSIVTL